MRVLLKDPDNQIDSLLLEVQAIEIGDTSTEIVLLSSVLKNISVRVGYGESERILHNALVDGYIDLLKYSSEWDPCDVD